MALWMHGSLQEVSANNDMTQLSQPGRFSLPGKSALGTRLSIGGTKPPPLPPKISRASSQTPKKSLDQKLAPKNPVPNFQTLKIGRKH